MALALGAVRGAPGGAGRVSLVVEGLAALWVGAGLETGPPAGDGGSGDGDGDGGHQVRVAGAGGAGQPDRARGIDGEDETAVGERPGQAGGGLGVLAAAGVRGQDIPDRIAQAQQRGVLGVAAGLGGQQARRAESAGCLLAGAELVRGGGAAQRVGELLDQL